MRRIVILLITLLLWSPSLFASKYIDDKSALISADEVIDDDVYIFSNSLDIYGRITQDLSGFVYDSYIEGTIDGNLNMFSYNIEVSGNILKSCRLIGQRVEVNGEIDGNLIVIGNEIQVDQDAVIGRDATIIGGVITINGQIMDYTEIRAETVTITGKIEGDVNIDAQEINIESGAVINGDLSYTSKEEAYIDDDAQITGEIDHSLPSKTNKKIGEVLDKILYIGKIISFFMALVTGLILITVFKNHARETVTYIHEKFLPSLGIGFLAMLICSFGALLIALFIVGIPTAIFLFFLGIFFFYCGKIYCSVALGQIIFKAFGRTDIGIGWSFIVGLIIITILFMIPVFGKLLYFLAFLIGAGGAIGGFMTICRKCREIKTETNKENI